MYNVSKLNEVKMSCLVTDIETCSFWENGGGEINIQSHFDEYTEHAEIKFIGMYSYRDDQYYHLNMSIAEDVEIAKRLIATHKKIVSFNGAEFDFPILRNNEMTGIDSKGKDMWYSQVDCMHILGTSNSKNRAGYAFKNRGELMGFDFKNNKLRTIAETMGLKTQKGDIDYRIFQKNSWTPEELKKIQTYLKGDVMATKEMFDALWAFWIPFVEMLDETSVYDLSWIRLSIASLTYKCACNVMDIEPTYGEYKGEKEEMGGRVILPKMEEARKVWYVDFASLYPHIFCMFNLFAETDKQDGEHIWHGNSVFNVKGYYDISQKHILTMHVIEKLKERINLKKTAPDDTMIYALKIFLNSLYGVARSDIFDQVGGKNCGWDCCDLGQQIHILLEEMMDDFGFDLIGGDTDSGFFIARDEENNNREYVIECLSTIVDIIKDNVPFPVDTFGIDIENYIEYLLFPHSMESISFKRIKLKKEDVLNEEISDSAWGSLRKYYKDMSDDEIFENISNISLKGIDKEENKLNLKIKNRLIREWTGKKKNYLYLYKKKDKETGEMKDDIKLVGLPIKKANATKLAITLYNAILKPIILEQRHAKFTKEKMDENINLYLTKPDVMNLIAREWKVKASDTYAKETQIQAQISRGYFGGEEGVISLVTNMKIGNAGKGKKYCTVQEAIDAKLTTEDLDLEKVYKELDPFIIYVPKVKKPKKVKAKKKTVKKVAKSK